MQEERIQKGTHYYIFSQFLPGDISFLEKNKWIFISIYCVPDMFLQVISLTNNNPVKEDYCHFTVRN